jgi:ribosomal-protein-alanine N-acetyltransferase
MPRAVVETPRLLLRPFAEADIVDYARVRADPGIAHWLTGGRGSTEEPLSIAQRIVPRFVAHWQERGYGPWAMVDKASGRLFGHMGLRFMPEFDEVEILYAMESAYWGRGLATEGAKASRDYAFASAGLPKVMAIALPDNRASIGVIRRLGMTYRKTVTYNGFEVAYHDLDRSAWRPGKSVVGQHAR